MRILLAIAIGMLSRGLASAQAPAPGATTGPSFQARQDAEPPRVQFSWTDHPSLRIGTLRVDFRARFQGDLRDSDAPLGDDDERAIDIARRRVGIDGQYGSLVAFQVERELTSVEPWRDVYVDYRQFGAARVQAGKFKLPFSLDENTSATNLDFAHRSRAATQLAPGRDRGVMLHGRLGRGTFGYEVGLFAHDGSNARSRSGLRVQGQRTIAGRVSIEPFARQKSALADLQVGLAVTTGDVPEGFTALRGTTALDGVFFPTDVWVKGKRQRTGGEFRWRPGPFSLKAEYIRVTEERLGQSIHDDDLAPMVAAGWYVSGTWALTRESKARGLDEPRRPLFRGGVGAVEVAGRFEELRFGELNAEAIGGSFSPRADVILGNRDRVLTVGVNWYLNRWVKIQANVIRDTIADPERGPLPGQQGFWSRIIRFQVTI